MQSSTGSLSRNAPEKHIEFNTKEPGGGSFSLSQSHSCSTFRAFQAWLDPAVAGRWLFATATRPMTCVTIDPRPGGRFEFADDSGRTREHGRYLDIQPSRHLAFSLARPGSRRGSRVVVEFRRRGSGCLVGLTHTGLPADQAAHMEARWEGMLYGLGLLLNSDTGWIATDNKSPRATSSRRPPLTRG